MDSFVVIVFWSLAALASLTALSFAFAVARILAALAATPRLADFVDQPAPATPESVCVIVPAHNEERVIAHTVRSIIAQDHPSMRVVFALDRCTDGTRAIIGAIIGADPRVEIVEIGSCPEDWAGKTNALRTAVARSHAAATADFLLFVDADTEMAPATVRAAVALIEELRVDLLSALGELARERWYERIVQPMTSLELLRQHPLDRVNRGRVRRAFANGQFMLFRAESYHALGGHGRVKDDLLEDLAFARALKNTGGSFAVALAGPMLRVRMYGSWDSFRRGWKRIFIESARRRPTRLRAYARRVRVAYVLLPICAAAALAAGAIGSALGVGSVAAATLVAGAVGVGTWIVAMTLALRAQGAGFGSVLASIVGGWLTAGILNEASQDLENNRGVRWGGRLYTDLTPAVADKHERRKTRKERMSQIAL